MGQHATSVMHQVGLVQLEQPSSLYGERNPPAGYPRGDAEVLLRVFPSRWMRIRETRPLEEIRRTHIAIIIGQTTPVRYALLPFLTHAAYLIYRCVISVNLRAVHYITYEYDSLVSLTEAQR